MVGVLRAARSILCIEAYQYGYIVFVRLYRFIQRQFLQLHIAEHFIELLLRLLTENLQGDAASQSWEDGTKPIPLTAAEHGRWIKFSYSKDDFTPHIPDTPVKIAILRAKYTAPEQPSHFLYLDNLRVE